MDVERQLREIIGLVTTSEERLAFPPGATEAEILAFEVSIGQTLPESLKRAYRLHDGEYFSRDPDLPLIGLFCDYEFLSLEKAAEICRRWDKAREYWAEYGGEPFTFTSRPANTVKSVLADPAWIPFAGYYAGCHLAIDFDPGPAGKVGQVVNFSGDDEVHFQIAPDFQSFLQLVLDHYRERRWHGLFTPSWSLYDTLMAERRP